MRFVLALAIAALGATSAVAQSSADRYGGGNPSRINAQPVETQQFRGLTWSSKTAGPTATLPPPPAPRRPEPLALASQYAGAQPWADRDLPPPPSARPQAHRPATYQPFQPQAPYFSQPTAVPAPVVQTAAATAAQGLPTSLYSATPPLRGPVLAGGPPPRKAPARPVQTARAAPPPPPVAAPAAAAPPPAQLAQAAPHGGEQARFYSLHRAYGLTPDTIPEQPAGDRYVLLGPADGAPQGGSVGRDDDDDTHPAKRDRPF